MADWASGFLGTGPQRPCDRTAAKQCDELAPFPVTKMHPIPHGPGAHRRIADCGGSVSGMLQTFAARRPSHDLRQIRAHHVATPMQSTVALSSPPVKLSQGFRCQLTFRHESFNDGPIALEVVIADARGTNAMSRNSLTRRA